VDYNYELFGQKLVDTALALIEKQQMPEKQTVEPVLILRGSSGKAPVS
jgi:LacI family transcriptional regulator